MTVYVVMISYRLVSDSHTTDIFDSVHADKLSAEKRVQDITDGVHLDNHLSFIRKNYLEEREYDDPSITTFFLPKISPYELTVPDNPIENKNELT